MSALRRSTIVATLLKLVGGSPKARSLTLGPGCTCASCVQAWGRQRPARSSVARDPRRQLRLGLY
jgi:hypothetical protein